jgi:excisionase family DNA binding protein
MPDQPRLIVRRLALSRDCDTGADRSAPWDLRSFRPPEGQLRGRHEWVAPHGGDVAELLGVPKSWVYEQSRAGRIPTVTLGRYRRYRREAIEAWVAQLESPARGARLYAPRAA